MKIYDDYFSIEGDKTRALVMLIGMDGTLFEHEERYLRIAEKAHSLYSVSVFAFRNPASNWDIQGNGFSAVMVTVKKTMDENCEIYFFGFSAGASFAIFNSWEYPEIKRLLLVNPPLMANFHRVCESMRRSAGTSTLVIGERDPSLTLGRIVLNSKKTSGFSDVIIHPGADHQFTGMTNEFIELPFTYLFNIP